METKKVLNKTKPKRYSVLVTGDSEVQLHAICRREGQKPAAILRELAKDAIWKRFSRYFTLGQVDSSEAGKGAH